MPIGRLHDVAKLSANMGVKEKKQRTKHKMMYSMHREQAARDFGFLEERVSSLGCPQNPRTNTGVSLATFVTLTSCILVLSPHVKKSYRQPAISTTLWGCP